MLTYLLFIAPGLLFALWASYKVRSSFQRYSQVASQNGYTGAEAARYLLDQAGLHDVRVVPTRGFLSDHYNPMTQELALSEAVYSSRSVAALGVAAHEAVDAVLNAAALTYVAAVVSTLMTLLFYLFQAGLLGGFDE
jgi:hypothetical protein